MRERRLRVATSLLVASLSAVAAACQPAADGPRDDVPAASGEPPPPPPPLPTEVAQEGAATDSATPPPHAADMPGPAPVTAPSAQPPAIEPVAECRAPAIPPNPAQQRIRVYFTCGEQVQPVERAVVPTRAVLRTSLEQLLRGPTPEERAAGFTSFFGEATADALNSVVVRDGVAHIDFADFSRAIPNASSSAGSTLLLAELRATLFQYPSVESAEITFDGSCDAFWNWLQRSCMTLSR